MTSNVQSIVCCLGDPVAGNPTQFLMQRAAAAQSLDWMFVTAEVPEAKIVEAFRGIRALGFSGVAFLPPHQLAGVALVDSLTESAMRSGHVRVARRDGDRWLGDDTLGAGIVELLQLNESAKAAEIGPPETQKWIAVAGRPWLAHLVRLALPTPWKSQLRILVQQSSVPAASNGDSQQLPTSEIESSNEIRSDENINIVELTYDAAMASPNSIDALILDSTAVCPSAKTVGRLAWSTNPTVIYSEPHSKWEASLSSLKNSPRFRILRAIDIASAKALINFHFWTGHQTDLSFIREALDEYCQW